MEVDMLLVDVRATSLTRGPGGCLPSRRDIK